MGLFLREHFHFYGIIYLRRNILNRYLCTDDFQFISDLECLSNDVSEIIIVTLLLILFD